MEGQYLAIRENPIGDISSHLLCYKRCASSIHRHYKIAFLPAVLVNVGEQRCDRRSTANHRTGMKQTSFMSDSLPTVAVQHARSTVNKSRVSKVIKAVKKSLEVLDSNFLKSDMGGYAIRVAFYTVRATPSITREESR